MGTGSGSDTTDTCGRTKASHWAANHTPVIAGIVHQVLSTPEPTDPIRDRPLLPALLPERVCTESLAYLHLETIGHTDHPNEPVHHRFRRERDHRRPYVPTAMPVAEGLFDGHALRIRRDGLANGRRGGEKHPGRGIALRGGTRWLRLAALLVRAVLGMGLGPLGALAHCARILLVLGRGHDGGADDDPARHQRLVGPPAA